MELSKATSILAKHGYTAQSIGRAKAAQLWGIHPSSARRLLNKLRGGLNAAMVGNAAKLVETVEQTDKRTDYTIPNTHIHTLEQLIDYFKVDISKWKCTRFIANKWEMGERGGMVTPLYQVKATFELIANNEKQAILKELESLTSDYKTRIKAYSPVVRLINRPPHSNRIVEISIPDLHYNKLAWNGETGHGNWDSKIAEAAFNRALDYIVYDTKHHHPEKYVYVVGNDLFNADSTDDMTTGGTPQDVDSRYFKSFERIREMQTRTIEKLRTIAPVDVIIMSGNHDALSCWHLGDSLKMLFHNCQDVTVDNRPLFRKCYQHGQVMLMFMHGDKVRPKEIPLLVATEDKRMFADTTFREVHMGHFHKEDVKSYSRLMEVPEVTEEKGVKCRILPSLCQPDVWHAQNGYVGGIRSAQAFVWDARMGLVATSVYNDPIEDK